MKEEQDDLTLVYMFGYKNGKDSMKAENERLLLIEQGAADLCDKCGWRMKFPNEECRNCENAKLRDEIERLRERGETTEWFWRIVDADGLGNVPSDEAAALNLLVWKANLYDASRKQEEALRAALLWYAERYCEQGFHADCCGKLGDDCRGCRARAALEGEKADD